MVRLIEPSMDRGRTFFKGIVWIHSIDEGSNISTAFSEYKIRYGSLYAVIEHMSIY